MHLWTQLIFFLIFFSSSLFAWNIGIKSRTSGPNIHSSYFLTPNNAAVPVTAKGYLGKFNNGHCNYNSIYDLGTMDIQTGDIVDIDAYLLKALVGMEYNCMKIVYTYKLMTTETFLLFFDGLNYVNSFPATKSIVISSNRWILRPAPQDVGVNSPHLDM